MNNPRFVQVASETEAVIAERAIDIARRMMVSGMLGDHWVITIFRIKGSRIRADGKGEPPDAELKR